MTTKEALSYMSSDEVAEFMSTLFVKEGNKFSTYYLKKNHVDLCEFISNAFIWDETKQGQKYWEGIALRQMIQEVAY